MRLRNKKTGEVVDLELNTFDINENCDRPITFEELISEWEEYGEEHWFISEFGGVYFTRTIPMDKERIAKLDIIGNYFGTKEEAEKAVEKLKAWKRLKEARIHFKDYHYELKDDDALITYELNIEADGFAYEDLTDDLKLLFGGEDE